MKEMLDIYLAVGAGGLCIIVICAAFMYKTVRMGKVMDSMKEEIKNSQTQDATYHEIIRNNTSAVLEVSKSNDNVASALDLLRGSIEHLNRSVEGHDKRMNTRLDSHDKRTEDLQHIAIRMDQKLDSIK